MQDYSFDRFSDFFEFQLKKNQLTTKSRQSLQQLARQLGYNSPSLLSMIASGKRLPSNALLESLFDQWNVDYTLREIIRTKVEIERRQSKNKPTKNLFEKLNKLDRKKSFKTINLDQFKQISEWQNLVLLQILSGHNDCEDPEGLYYKLRKKVSQAKIRQSLETLLRCGILKKDPVTGKVTRSDNYQETTHDIPSEAIREHHRGMLHRALEALDEQAVEERHFNSLTLKFSEDSKKEAKETILNFVRHFNEIYSDENSEDIYQLNLQFFAHTSSRKPPGDKLQ